MLETRDVPGATELEAPSRRPRSTGEPDAPQHLAEARRADRPEVLTRRGPGGIQRVGDLHQLVRVGALVSAAHRGGDGPDRHRAVGVDPAGDVVQPVGGRRPRLAGRRGDRTSSSEPEWSRMGLETTAALRAVF